MKVVNIELVPALDALVKELYQNHELEPISLTRGSAEVAVIVSSAEYKALRKLEESLLDKLDIEESERILEDPKWIGWDELQNQFKS